jgi:hypothetical protein
LSLASNHGFLDRHHCSHSLLASPAQASRIQLLKQNGIAGGLNTIGIVSTIISAQIADKLGRRICLMGVPYDFLQLSIAASLYESLIHDPSKAPNVAPAAVTMLFPFNLIYATTWGTVAFLIPTEIFLSEMRAQGNGSGITGWAIGVGWTCAGEPHYVRQHPEPNVLPFRRSEPHLDSHRLLLLP